MSARSFTLNKKRQGNITVNKTDAVDGHGATYQVILHNTAVVASNAAGGFILNSGGWRTNTTRRAINRALDLLGVNAGIHQKRGKWLITVNGEVSEFFDGMCVR